MREKGDTRDSKGLYLICQSKTEPEMYELVCRSTEDRKSWIATIRAAIASCPEEGIVCLLTKHPSCLCIHFVHFFYLKVQIIYGNKAK